MMPSLGICSETHGFLHRGYDYERFHDELLTMTMVMARVVGRLLWMMVTGSSDDVNPRTQTLATSCALNLKLYDSVEACPTSPGHAAACGVVFTRPTVKSFQK